jgi:hypothetical protein
MHSWTRIHTHINDYTIGNFVRSKINDKIITYNEQKDEFEEHQAVAFFDNGFAEKDDFIKVCFQTPSHRRYQKIICTKNFKILTKEGYKEAQHLSENDFLVGCCENPLSSCQEQILLGSLLGDGFLHISTLKASLRLENSEQLEYLMWKVDNLSCLKFAQQQKHADKYDSEFSLFLKNYYNMFYENHSSRELKEKTGRLYRTFSPEVFNKINVLGLAVFYLDDGSLIDNKVHICSKRFRHLSNCCFFDSLLERFKHFGLNGIKLNNGYRIMLSEESSFKFSNMIKEFVTPIMQYKLIQKHRNLYNSSLFMQEQSSVKYEKIFAKVIKLLPIKKEVATLRRFNVQTQNNTYLVGSAKEFSGVVVYNDMSE